MQLWSVPFAALVILGLSLTHLCRTARQRRFVLLLLTAVFLSCQVDSLKALVPLGCYLGLCVLAVGLVNRCRSRPVFLGCLGVLLGAFLYLKHYGLAAFLPPLPWAYLSVGLSYIVLRAIHLLVNTYHGESRRHDLEAGSLLNYFAFFLSLTAGPIQRYEDYQPQEAALDRPAGLIPSAMLGALVRLANGYLMLAFLGPVLSGLHNHLFDEVPHHRLAFAGTAGTWILYVYVNFAGYMDIVIGLGRLFGLELPENFDAPFRCANFLDLWNRWHITLSTWFRDYVFNPIVRGLCQRWQNPALLPYFGVLAYFVVFFLLGVWHGADTRFVVLGLLFGLGASVNKLFQVEMTRRLGPERVQGLWQRAWYQALARALALSYFCFAEAVIWGKVPTLRDFGHVLAALGWVSLVVNFGVCVAAIMAIEAVARCGWWLARRSGPVLAALGGHLSAGPLALGLRLVLLLVLLSKAVQAMPAPARAPATDSAAARAARPQPTDVFYGRF